MESLIEIKQQELKFEEQALEDKKKAVLDGQELVNIIQLEISLANRCKDIDGIVVCVNELINQIESSIVELISAIRPHITLFEKVDSLITPNITTLVEEKYYMKISTDLTPSHIIWILDAHIEYMGSNSNSNSIFIATHIKPILDTCICLKSRYDSSILNLTRALDGAKRMLLDNSSSEVSSSEVSSSMIIGQMIRYKCEHIAATSETLRTNIVTSREFFYKIDSIEMCSKVLFDTIFNLFYIYRYRGTYTYIIPNGYESFIIIFKYFSKYLFLLSSCDMLALIIKISNYLTDSYEFTSENIFEILDLLLLGRNRIYQHLFRCGIVFYFNGTINSKVFDMQLGQIVPRYEKSPIDQYFYNKWINAEFFTSQMIDPNMLDLSDYRDFRYRQLDHTLYKKYCNWKSRQGVLIFNAALKEYSFHTQVPVSIRMLYNKRFCIHVAGFM